ncbi:MAG: RagB/SusD family nutrient uptake outer membrane protein, partial [Paludibacteraceae bacterium]|nr:RagB/SusD family nutrient uptake outer membrane protein [Paludibacteraceae bacterium]
MKKNIFIIIALVAMAFAGCDFLDHEPDMRASIDSKEKVQLLLVSAYTEANSAPLCEYSSDNVIDNNVPDPRTGQANAVNPLDEMYNEIFAWKPVKQSSNDSPKLIWDAHYTAIATANQALEAIKELEVQGIKMDAEKGEALLSRAYHHFLLAGVFCQAWKNEEDSKKDLGLTYMMQPETKVAPEYSRGPELVVNTDENGDTVWIGGSLHDTYMNIQRDLEAGLKLVSDEYYNIPRYHFNVKAAHAFAARFYLYKREWAKVVEHADYVLTTTDETTLAMLFDATTNRDQSNIELAFKHYIDVQAPSNLLLIATYSSSAYAHFP